MLAVGYEWWLPINASAHGGAIDNLIVLTHWFMAVLFVGWGAYFIYSLVRFRSRSGHEATVKLPKAKTSKISEIIVVIVEAVLLLAFSIPIWGQVRGASHAPDPNDALQVRVVAEQFAWNIHYPGRDGVFGPTDPALISTENPIGLDRDQEAAKDDIVTLNQLHVPVDRDVLVHLTSKDVIHGFNVPLLRVKQDVIPGMSSPVWFRASKTTDQIRDQMVRTYPVRVELWHLLKNHVAMERYEASDGSVIVDKAERLSEEIVTKLAAAGIAEIRAAPWNPTEIACAQLCGVSHYVMRGYLYIDTDEQYEAWLAEEEAWLADQDDEDEGF